MAALRLLPLLTACRHPSQVKVAASREAYLNDSLLALEVPLALVKAPLALPQLPPERQQLHPLSIGLIRSLCHVTSSAALRTGHAHAWGSL